jgi:hypothetical protein
MGYELPGPGLRVGRGLEVEKVQLQPAAGGEGILVQVVAGAGSGKVTLAAEVAADLRQVLPAPPPAGELARPVQAALQAQVAMDVPDQAPVQIGQQAVPPEATGSSSRVSSGQYSLRE